MSSMSGPYKAEQALLFVPDGLLEAGEPIFWRNAVGALKKKMGLACKLQKQKLLRKKVCQKWTLKRAPPCLSEPWGSSKTAFKLGTKPIQPDQFHAFSCNTCKEAVSGKVPMRPFKLSENVSNMSVGWRVTMERQNEWIFFGCARGRVPRFCFAVCTWCSASIFRFRFQRNLAAGYLSLPTRSSLWSPWIQLSLHQSERGRQLWRPKNDGTSFFGSKRRPGASVSRMNQRGRSSLATHPAVFSNFLNGADPAAQARQLSRAHGCTYMASLLKVLPAVRCYHVKVTYCHFEN